MPMIRPSGESRWLGLVAASAVLLGLVGCSNGRGSVGDGEARTPPTEPANPPNTFTVGGTVSGLQGSGLVLQLNGADDTTILRNGSFLFPQAQADGASYTVTVAAQPSNPTQTCSVANATGIIDGADVTDVSVVCSTQSFNVGGSVAGLEGKGLVLTLNGTEDLTIASNGSFTFPTALASGSAYEVLVKEQPQNPTQSCTVANASGTVGAGAVRTVTVTCATNTYALGGTVVGLEGDRVVLANSSDTVVVESDGAFVFPTRIASGGTYDVRVRTHPEEPAQACTVANGTGTVTSADVTNVTVTCERRRFLVGGIVSGLAGTGLRLQNNGGDELAIASDGPFVFATAIESGRSYDVTVAAQPTGPAQECTVDPATARGTVATENIANVRIHCVTIEHTLGGTVAGLRGSGLVLRNEGIEELPIAADGPFTFPTSLRPGTPYRVTVAAQPSDPTQQCTVSEGSGTMGESDVDSVRVACVTSRFNISVEVVGLRGPQTLVLRNNDSDTLFVTSNGMHTFSTPVESGAPYHVSIVSGPPLPPLPPGPRPMRNCTFGSPASGIVADRDVVIEINCD